VVGWLFRLWDERVPAESDLCCYWFEKSRAQIEKGLCDRAGLLATQGIRGGANREVLDRIKQSGDIFFAESDRDWVLDGATVHVSMVGFDDGQESFRVLDGLKGVEEIFPNLTASVNVTKARTIPENAGISFMGDTKGAKFEALLSEIGWMLSEPNPNGLPNSDVIRPWLNAESLTRAYKDMLIVDFGAYSSEPEASLYEAPFSFVEENVKAKRLQNRRELYRTYWWRHVEPRPGMRRALLSLPRFLATPIVSKFRLFAWLAPEILADHALIVFARADDYYFGVLHSRLHEVWALSQGTQVRERESGFRYIPTKTFETFPFPHPSSDQEVSIAAAAKELDDLRNRWLNPPEWTREEILEFPGSVNGPWTRYVHDPDERGIGTVRYPRLVPKDEEAAEKLKTRTLTNLYNQRPAWLDLAHRKLDEVVFAAYGWDPGISDEEILERLLALNLERAGAEETAS